MKKAQQYSTGSKILTAFFVVLCIIWVAPIFEVAINSVKDNAYVSLAPFALPNEESFVGFANYIKGFTFGNYPFLKSVCYSVFITVASVFLILHDSSLPDGHVYPVFHR